MDEHPLDLSFFSGDYGIRIPALMTKQIVLQPSATSVSRRQPLLTKNQYSSTRSVRAAEVAGGTAAECAAICCCCPCALLELVVLAVYKVPAGLCRKAMRRKRRRMLMKKGMLPQRRLTRNDTELLPNRDQELPVSVGAADATEPDKDVMELEKEMWDKFHGAGFWRSPSQKGD